MRDKCGSQWVAMADWVRSGYESLCLTSVASVWFCVYQTPKSSVKCVSDCQESDGRTMVGTAKSSECGDLCVFVHPNTGDGLPRVLSVAELPRVRVGV